MTWRVLSSSNVEVECDRERGADEWSEIIFSGVV